MLAAIRAIIAEAGYEVTDAGDQMLVVADPESQVQIRAAMEGDVLFLTVVCLSVERHAISRDTMSRMLAADNGISTSFFQIYPNQNGLQTITLNNFCKLQELGDDDADDILSCLNFLLADIVQARNLIGDLA